MTILTITLIVLFTEKFNQVTGSLININILASILSGNYEECLSRQYYRTQSLILMRYIFIFICVLLDHTL